MKQKILLGVVVVVVYFVFVCPFRVSGGRHVTSPDGRRRADVMDSQGCRGDRVRLTVTDVASQRELLSMEIRDSVVDNRPRVLREQNCLWFVDNDTIEFVGFDAAGAKRRTYTICLINESVK